MVRFLSRIALITFGFSFVACMSADDRARTVRIESVATGVCTIHRVPLQRTVMYDFTEPVPFDLELPAIRLARRYPNVEPSYIPESAPNDRKRVVVRVCPICERLYRQEIRRLYGHYATI